MNHTVQESREELSSLAFSNQEKAKGLAWVATDFFKRKTNQMLRHDEKVAEDIKSEIEKNKNKLENYFDENDSSETGSEINNTQTPSPVPSSSNPKPPNEEKSENQDVNFI